MASEISIASKNRGNKALVEPASGNGTDDKGLKITTRFTKSGKHPFETITWEKRTAKITNENGEVIFEHSPVPVSGNPN